MKCKWCRKEYDGLPLYHICPDGTNYSDRWGKSAQDFEREYARQDRVATGLTKWEWSPAPQPITRKRDVVATFAWTPDDDALLKGMKIIWDDYDEH
jgi:hypothetical protein